MRRIGVTQRLVRDVSTGEERDALDLRWTVFLEQCALLAVPAPSSASPEQWLEALSIQGVLITGGNDLSSVSDDPLSARRDAFERALLAATEARGIPVLGVCRGLQLIAALDGVELTRIEGHVRSRHRVSVEPDARWLAGPAELEVNSYHDWGLRSAGAKTRVAAFAADGTIEALEHLERPLMGIMWHPEREPSAVQSDLKLFRRFLGGSSA